MGVIIYAGFEYTRETYRGQKINKKLREFAYSQIAHPVLESLHKSPVKNVTLIYGLTYKNAGEDRAVIHDRTPGLAKTFHYFIKNSIQGHISGPVILEISRYNSQMPTFDPKSTDCKNPQKEKSVPGYGFILTCELH